MWMCVDVNVCVWMCGCEVLNVCLYVSCYCHNITDVLSNHSNISDMLAVNAHKNSYD